MGYRILQWNFLGLNPTYNELVMLIRTLDPVVICVQETFLNKINVVNIRNYQKLQEFVTVINNDVP